MPTPNSEHRQHIILLLRYGCEMRIVCNMDTRTQTRCTQRPDVCRVLIFVIFSLFIHRMDYYCSHYLYFPLKITVIHTTVHIHTYVAHTQSSLMIISHNLNLCKKYMRGSGYNTVDVRRGCCHTFASFSLQFSSAERKQCPSSKHYL